MGVTVAETTQNNRRQTSKEAMPSAAVTQPDMALVLNNFTQLTISLVLSDLHNRWSPKSWTE